MSRRVILVIVFEGSYASYFDFGMDAEKLNILNAHCTELFKLIVHQESEHVGV